MPVYEYQCSGCGRKFEVVASLAEKEAGLRPVCPKCGVQRATQIFSRFTLLAGSKTDVDAEDDIGDNEAADSNSIGADDFDDDMEYDDLDSSEDL